MGYSFYLKMTVIHNSLFESGITLSSPHVPPVAGARQDFSITEHGHTAQDNFADFALHLPAFERGPAAAGEALAGFDLVDGIFVHFYICLWLFRQIEYAFGVFMQLLHNMVYRQPSIVYCFEQ